ncbi:MAG: hydrogen gas-evolving membrane-bound hydrogenase subunit E [Emergencia sp.]
MKKDFAKAAGIVLLICIVFISWGIIDLLPVIGDPDSPPNTHVSTTYIEEGPENTNSPNLVTGVLADYRGFDTLLETTVMFLAGLAVAMILSNRMRKDWDPSIFGNIRTFGGPDVKVVIPVVVPAVLIYAVYVLFHGEVSLGGGFQAGALIAMAYILYAMIAGIRITSIRVTQYFAVCTAAAGVFIYALTGILPMLCGGKYLEYSRLPFPVHETAELHSIGILLIEIGVTICVAATIITILEALLERKSLYERD